ncbi:MAG: DUF4159 domain-containing protein [Acidobacteriota bacterium]
MRFRTALAIVLMGLAALGVLWGQKPFREWPAIEYESFPLPADANRPAEWTRARLRYPDITGYNLHGSGRYFAFPGYWTMDYPRSDRHLLQGVRRLTRIDSRSTEQVVDLDGTGEVNNWPILYAAEVGHWMLPEDEAQHLRDYLLKGGFFMCDDFHGTVAYRGVREWDTFVDSMKRVFPDRPIEDIPANDPIFHTIYDLQERFQVPGAQFLETGLTYEDGDTGKEPHWRCIRDDKGRIMVAICHNMDLGDAWEHSDNPLYPEKYASLAYRIAMNYFIYDLTH